MAVGDNNGTTYVPADLRAAVESPGFAEAARKLAWNAPQPRTPQNDNRAEKEDTREQAKKTIENGLATIRDALLNPNLTEAQRAELVGKQTQLEGLQVQMANGMGGVSPQQAAAVAAQVSQAAAATIASVGGVAGNVTYQQLQANYEQARANYQRVSQESFGWLNNTRERFDSISRESSAVAQKYGIDVADEEKKIEEAKRKEKEAEKNNDPMAAINARIEGLDAGIAKSDKILSNPSVDSKDREAETKRRDDLIKQREDAVKHRMQLTNAKAEELEAKSDLARHQNSEINAKTEQDKNAIKKGAASLDVKKLEFSTLLTKQVAKMDSADKHQERFEARVEDESSKAMTFKVDSKIKLAFSEVKGEATEEKQSEIISAKDAAKPMVTKVAEVTEAKPSEHKTPSASPSAKPAEPSKGIS